MALKACRRAVGVGSNLALVFLGLATTTPAWAADVSCGQTILVDTVLDGDVGPCPTGLVIGSDNITLDLNGFTVSGIPTAGEGPGVFITGSGVTVKNGTVTGFDAGVAIDSGSNNTVRDMRLISNFGTGEYGDGVAVFASTGNRILGNQVKDNGPYSGISLIASDSNTVDRNQVVSNNRNFQTGGIRIENIGFNSSDANTITNNSAQGNALDGIQLFAGSDDNVVRNNLSVSNGRNGITAFAGSTGNVIEGNRVQGHAQEGIYIRDAAGKFPAPTANRILRNSSSQNGLDLRDGTPNCGTNIWSGNQAATFTPACTMNP